MPRLTIDGRDVETADGVTVLQAMRSIGVDVPTLCYDDRLAPYGGCRLCIVNVKGSHRPVAACTALVVDRMEIETHTPALERLRRTQLELLAEHYPADAVDVSPDEPFHRYLSAYGVVPRSPSSAASTAGLSTAPAHPYIHVDMSRCITCFRCVRICDEVQGARIWRAWQRGDATAIRAEGGNLATSACVSCGACVDTCPTGALEDQSILREGAPTAWTRTICPYCGVGCELRVGTRNGRIITTEPVLDAPVNRGHACVKGRYATAFVHAHDRVTSPLVRDVGHWRDATWTEAVETVASRLRSVIARHGPDAVGILGSARATNEENYLTQKFARLVVGTNNVDCCARVCHAPSAAALKAMLGNGAASNSFDDIERARTILVVGANATESHPVIGARIAQAARRGARLIVVDPRATELARSADVHLALTPGTNIPLLNAMAHVILTERLWDRAFVERRVDGWETFVRSIADWTPARAASICHLAAENIVKAARIYATRKPSLTAHGLGVTEHTQGVDGVCGLVNLALLTGNLGIPGAGVNPLRGQNNVQGAAHMGCDPATLTGGVPLEQGRAGVERVWQDALPHTSGLRLLDMIDAASGGRLKALWVIGYDILLTNPHIEATRRALQALDLLVVQDLFLTQTAAYAHVFLPAASSFEKDGTFMNAERRVQRLHAAIGHVGQARPDWAIICAVAAAMGHGQAFGYQHAEEIWDEIRDVWPAGRGMTTSRLDAAGLQWPCPGEDDPGTPVLYQSAFPEGRASLRCLDYHPTAERADEGYPFLLITGRVLPQFNAGTMTDRTPNHELRPADVLEVSPSDAEWLGLREGDAVRVISRWGATVLPIGIRTRVQAGQVFATFHTARAFVNGVTSPLRDPATGTPEYKVTAVRLEPINQGISGGNQSERKVLR
jgi:formate dehydrogenase major subunit